MGAGLGLLASTEGKMGVQITGENWLLPSAPKHLEEIKAEIAALVQCMPSS